MKLRTLEYRAIGALCILLAGLCIAGVAEAQVGATRPTACSPTTPNNAICLEYSAPATYTSGDAIPASVALTFRIEQRIGTSGAWSTVAASTSSLRHYLQNLTPGTYTYRVYANCAGCTEGPASNAASRDATAPPPPQPGAPVLTIAVVIGVDHAPVYSIINGDRRGPEVIGFVPVGAACSGKVVFRFREQSYRRVSCADVKRWAVECRNPAAACARQNG